MHASAGRGNTWAEKRKAKWEVNAHKLNLKSHRLTFCLSFFVLCAASTNLSLFRHALNVGRTESMDLLSCRTCTCWDESGFWEAPVWVCNCLLLLVFVFLCNALLHCLATTNLAVTLPPLFFGEILYEVSMIISLAYLLVEYPMISLISVVHTWYKQIWFYLSALVLLFLFRLGLVLKCKIPCLSHLYECDLGRWVAMKVAITSIQ